MLLTVTGEKGSPGATTTALALGHALAGSRLVIEADASGGDLAFRLRRDGRPLPESPTVLTAVAAARNEVNLRAGRKFNLAGTRLDASIDVFNVLNGGAPERFRTDANQLYNPSYLVAQNLQPPRVVQASLRFSF